MSAYVVSDGSRLANGGSVGHDYSKLARVPCVQEVTGVIMIGDAGGFAGCPLTSALMWYDAVR